MGGIMKNTLLLIFAILFSSFATAANTTLINGAGSTFAAPLYSKWIAEYHAIENTVEINYQSIGSGGGVRQFIAGTTDFGASDDPMKDEETAQIKEGVVHVPTAIGGVVITYNIPGVTGALKFTSDVIAEIYLGKITNWNDAKIKALNPESKLPNLGIITAYRADGSGTTAVFTDYLSRESAEWKGRVGQGKSVKFPTGLGGKGNEGVTGLIRQNPGAIGYIELTYAKVNNLPMASLKNKAGQFVEPTLESLSQAAASLKNVPTDLRMSLLGANGKSAYPIAAFTYLLVSKRLEPAKLSKLLAFVKWGLGDGQKVAQGLNYGPLPDGVLTKAKAIVEKLSK